jgi:Uma2 family endonuclease
VVSVELDQVYRFTLDQYHELIELGAFDHLPRVELIEGLLVEMGRESREHDEAITWLTEWLATGFDWERHHLKVRGPLTFEHSEPEPDLAIVPRDAPRPYHSATAELVIEVSAASLRHASVIKQRLYARAGIPEYWGIDLDGHRVVRHREPADNAYRHVDELRAGDELTTLGLPPLDIAELFAAAFG